jgi:Ca2+-binding RTX toxin-like protein
MKPRWAASGTLTVMLLLGTPAAAQTTEATCQSAPATVVGTEGSDSLVGTPDRDVFQLFGSQPGQGTGDDRAWGQAGNDLMCGGKGPDVMTGMRGRDLLFGQGGNDDLDGSDGADHIWAGSGDDDLNGGLGDDRVLGGRGNDTLDFVGFTHADYGFDYLEGGAGSDTIVARDGVGNDTANCGADEDWATVDLGDMVIDCEHVNFYQP